ncbi:hypothetical protein [Sphingobacterium pedocola]|uniref:Uncharacterized protein n=1 Tax=Sphingobacterium pedocola TaxID=2082722 RepID=A0ABR9T2R6_9SPHI|nr:hypothetical protein [Sphingobacterium pedocola]MBE8719641.1 hypothetical protein [Sphingobacterium pedocola]
MGVYHGALIDPNWLAENGTRDRNDEPWEQQAISVGRKHAKILLKQGKYFENKSFGRKNKL